MGVPGFVTWLRDYCKDKMILTTLPSNCKILYIDANCLIHPKCFEILEHCKNIIDISKLENLMFKRIVKFIEFLVDYANPDECFLAVDGVAPVAKITQQQKRRFKSIDDSIMKDNLKIKHKIPLSVKWSNTVITPGTEFMERLHYYLLKHFAQKMKDPKNKTIYIYSSYHTPGEGEHKILEDIRLRLKNDTAKEKDIYVIYGLDADLFFLAMASKKKNIYLLREEHHFFQGKVVKHELFDPIDDIVEDMRFVSIDITKECYSKRMAEIISKKMNQDYNNNNNFCNDFVFLCYLLGNDFLPHFPSIDIHKEGLDILIDTYTDIFIKLNKNYLIQVDMNNNVEINNIFLLELLEQLGNKEEIFFTEIQPEYKYNRQKKKCYANDNYSRELWEIENMKVEISDPIKLGKGEKDVWKFRYYEYYFGVSEHYQKHVDLMSHMYLEGLIWVARYYYNGCESWTWQYPFTHAPFVSDVYKYMKNKNININKIKFNKAKPLPPCVQLISVLPPSCSHLMPINYSKLVTDLKSPIIDMFPKQVKIDMINKDMNWMCIPLLPYLNVERILDATKNIKLNKDEDSRNKELENFKFL